MCGRICFQRACVAFNGVLMAFKKAVLKAQNRIWVGGRQ